MTEILKSTTCACYRDDDGLHPCETYKRMIHATDQTYHALKAFGLNQVAPEKPKRAVKLENGLWQAPCGCEVDLDGYRLCDSCPDYYGPNHLIKAVAAVMREQVPPRPTDDEIDAEARQWTQSAGFYGGVRWLQTWLERKP